MTAGAPTAALDMKCGANVGGSAIPKEFHFINIRIFGVAVSNLLDVIFIGRIFQSLSPGLIYLENQFPKTYLPIVRDRSARNIPGPNHRFAYHAAFLQ